jgi:glycosyltransferase involved in cell wall biosynthesis
MEKTNIKEVTVFTSGDSGKIITWSNVPDFMEKKTIRREDSQIMKCDLIFPLFPNVTEYMKRRFGIEKAKLDSLPENVFCYGYLDKGNENDRKLYYKLFREATIYINTTPKWSAFSASIEAMYFYTPVVVTPYGEFVETFGKEINFGSYCEINSPDLIGEKIKNILIDASYEELCVCAHQAVKEFTWSEYIEKLIVHIE